MKNTTLAILCGATVLTTAATVYTVGTLNQTQVIEPQQAQVEVVAQQPQATNKVYQSECNMYFPPNGHSYDYSCTVTMDGNNGFTVKGGLGIFSIETTNRPGVVDFVVPLNDTVKGYKMSSDKNECTTSLQSPDDSATITIRNFCFWYIGGVQSPPNKVSNLQRSPIV